MAVCPGFTRSEFHQRMELDVNEIPGWMWMSASSVVETSLDCGGSAVKANAVAMVGTPCGDDPMSNRDTRWQ